MTPERPYYRTPARCPNCGLYMSWREEDEQSVCNECYGQFLGPVAFYDGFAE